MDWSIFVYFLAAVVAAGVSYAVWPKDHRPWLPTPLKEKRSAAEMADGFNHAR